MEEENKTDNEFSGGKEIPTEEVRETDMNVDKITENNSNEVHPKILLTEKSIKIMDKVLFGCYIAGVVGIVLFLVIVIVGAIAYGRVYLFDGYAFTKVLSIISIILMLVGICSVAVKAVLSLILKIGEFPKTIVKRILLILLAAGCLAFSIWGFVDCAKCNNKDSGSSSSSSSGSSGSSTVSQYIGLSLKVTNIKTSGSYTYVYCSVTNVSEYYGNATMYRYIKVKGVFYDRYGSIVDTDWTYAIDSNWLYSGETKTFQYMVRNTSISTAKLYIAS